MSGRLRVRCLWVVLALVASAAHASAQSADVDAGAEEDAGVEQAGARGVTGPSRPALLPTEPIVVLPPVKAAPQIAPVVEESKKARPPEAPIASADRPAALIKTILGLLTLITLAYLGGHPRVLALERQLGISQVITAGLPFVMLGWLARTPVIGLLNDELLAELSPLLRIGLGCIGLVAGYGFSQQLRTAPALMQVAAFAAGVPFVLVAMMCGPLLLWMSGDLTSAALRDPVFVRDALILGTAGAMTAPSSTHVVHADDSQSMLARTLRTEELAGMIGLAIIAAYFRPQSGVTWQLPGTAWLLLTLGLGGTLGLIAYLILRRLQEGPEFVLLTLGILGFSAGTAGYLRLSPVVIAFLAGLGLALLPELPRSRLNEALRRMERPIYLLSLIVIGALWQIDDWRGWLLVPAFTLARLIGKRVGLDLGLRRAGFELEARERHVLSMAPIGSLAIAIVVNAQLLYPGGSISPIVAAVIVGGMLTEVAFQLASRRMANPPDTRSAA